MDYRHHGDIHEGDEVYDASNTVIGRVRHVTDDMLDLGDRRIPVTLVSRVADHRVYLAETATADSGGMHETNQELRVPVVEEQLTVEKRAGQVGEVRIRRQVVETVQTVPVDLRREELYVEYHPIEARRPRADELVGAFEERTIRVRVRGEEPIVDKQAVVTGEVVINKERTVERQEIRDTVRRTEVDVDEDYQRARTDSQQQPQERSSTDRTRTFEEAESHYQYGWRVAREQRFAGRDFDEVEPELRAAYRTAGYSDDEWEQLREEVRVGWDSARDR